MHMRVVISAGCKCRLARRYRPALPQPLSAPPTSHVPDRLKTNGRAVDGGLAVADAGDGGCRPRSLARAQRVRVDGGTLADRLPVAVADDLPRRRLCPAENIAAQASRRAQSHPLRLAARLVLRADPDPDRAGGGDRVHHADL